MIQGWRSLFLITLPFAILGCFASINTARAQQVSADGTLSTTVTTDDNKNFNINNGNRVGGNLFHSFKEFSVPTNGSAVFNNALDVQNIISRVTGGSVSNIDGLIKANGAANLFLINPSGIIFGPNASLNIGGSFLASTANSLIFGNGLEFSATNPQAPPLLAVNIPIGLQFRENPGSITSQSTAGLEVQSGKSLTLVGAKVSLEGGSLTAPGGRVELGGLAASGTVGINSHGSLSFPNDVARANVSLTNGAKVDVRNPVGKGGEINITTATFDVTNSQLIASTSGQGDAGNININTNSLSVTNNSFLAASANGQGNAGKITINARDKVSFDGSQAYTNVDKLPSDADVTVKGNGSNINITTGALDITNGSKLTTSTIGQGYAGNINISTRSLDITNGSTLITSTTGQGDAGKININTGSLSVTNESYLAASANGDGGNAGKITITGDMLSFNNGAKVYTNVTTKGHGDDINITAGSLDITNGAQLVASTSGQGDAGNININTNSLSVTNKSFLAASANGQGNAGKITINARDKVSFDESQAYTNVDKLPSDADVTVKGNGSNINITTGALDITNGSKLTTSTIGQGYAGNINISTRSLDITNGSTLITSTTGQGDAGKININTGSLSVTNESYLAASANGDGGNAGKITITGDMLSFNNGAKVYTDVTTKGRGGDINIATGNGSLYITNGAQLQATTKSQGGNAGDINIDTGSLYVTNAAFIDSTTDGPGNAGHITINASDTVSFNGADPKNNLSRLTVNSKGSGNAGSLTVSAPRVILDNQAVIRADTTSSQGNIELTTGDLILRHNSNISTNATGTVQGGNITINTDNLVALENSNITATGNQGIGGNISITAKGYFHSRDSVITAASGLGPQFNGRVQLNTPDVDPSRTIVKLPQTVVDPVNKIAQNPCQQGTGSAFIVTGRGGLPRNPNEALSSNNVLVDLVEPVLTSTHSPSASIKPLPTKPTVKRIVPAQGWVFNDQGKVVLTAYDPLGTGHQRTSKAPAACPAF